MCVCMCVRGMRVMIPHRPGRPPCRVAVRTTPYHPLHHLLPPLHLLPSRHSAEPGQQMLQRGYNESVTGRNIARMYICTCQHSGCVKGVA